MNWEAWTQAPMETGTALAVLAVATALGGLLAVLLHRWLRRLEDRIATDADGQPPTIPPWRIASRVLPPLWVLSIGFLVIDATELLPVGAVLRMLRDVLNASLVQFGEVDVTPMTVLTITVVLLLTHVISRGLQAAVSSSLRSRTDADDGLIKVLQRLSHYGLMAIGGIVALQTAGVNLSALVAASAVLAVGIGFGLQNLAQNFVSGIMLLLERTIKPGDILTVEGELVRVQEMGIRATVARTLDDEDLIIPNSKLVEGVVINHSLRTNVVRARAAVGVAYESDLDQVFEVLRAATLAFSHRAKSREPVVLLTEFGSSSIDFEVSIWVPSAFTRPRVLSDLRLTIWRALRDAGITIAFPQVDVHFDPPVVQALQQRSQQDGSPQGIAGGQPP